jgi:hypothetical protein
MEYGIAPTSRADARATRRSTFGRAAGFCIALGTLAASMASQPAAAQVEVALPGAEGRRSRVVMSGREFDAVAEAVGFDPSQRTVVDAMFDDAQARMFDAKRTADAAARKVGLFDQSREATATRSAAMRALRTAMLAQVDELFASLAAISRPDQQTALAHERRLARLCVIRTTMPPRGFMEFSTRIEDSDAVAAVDAAATEGTDLARVHDALAASLDRLADALVRLGDARAERTLALAEAPGRADSDPKTTAARNQARDALMQASRVHRDSLVALEGVLAGQALQDAKAAAARAIWPSSADARSPRRAIGQLLRKETDAERRTAIEGVRDTWWAAWWPATLRIIEALETAGGRPPVELVEARAVADRTAWQALAALDPANRDFHLANADPGNGPAGRVKAMDFGPAIEPGLPGSESGPGGVSLANGVSISFSAVTIRAEVSGDADSGTTTEASDAPEAGDAGGAVAIALGEALEGIVADQVMVVGDASVLGDASFDFGGDMEDFGAMLPDPEAMQGFNERSALAGARIPPPMTDDDVRRIASALGIAADDGVLAQVVRDYLDRTKASDDELGARIRTLLDGTAVAWPMTELPQAPGLPALPPERPEVPITDVREAIGLLDQWTERLGTLDDAVIDTIAALGTPRPEAVQGERERRARARAGALRYPSADGMDGRQAFVEPADALAPSGADATALGAAARALEAWSPAALAAVEANRAAVRGDCVALIEFTRTDAAGMRAMQADDGNQKALPFDEESMKRRIEAESRLAKARQAMAQQAVAGRDAAEAALPESIRGAYRSAWYALAAPYAYRDRSDALPAVDRARGLADLSGAQRAQLDALWNDHASRHRASCDAIAEMMIAQQTRIEDAMQDGSNNPMDSMFGTARLLSDARFERRELDARTLRRLRAVLTPEQAKEIPQLQPRGLRRFPAGMPGGMPGAVPMVIPSPTPAEPAPKSP